YLYTLKKRKKNVSYILNKYNIITFELSKKYRINVNIYCFNEE
ncbi:MAG: hypothetical protein ACI90V_014235, partial [Bacillariaceae sp.]